MGQPFDMGQGNSVSTSNAQQTSAEQSADISGNKIHFGNIGGGDGVDMKTIGLVAAGLAVLYFVVKK